MKKLLEYLTIYDKILIISILAFSLVFILLPFVTLLTRGEEVNKYIIIQSSQGEQQRIAVETTYQEEPIFFSVEGPIGFSLVEAHNGRVRIKEAPPADPEKICEKTSWIEQSGQIIICVPNQLSVWIEAEESDLDGVSW